RLSKVKLMRFLGAAHVEIYRNIPLLIQLFAVYLVITEFLPDIFEPIRLGSWLMLSKAGLFVACPENLLFVTVASIVLSTLAAWLVFRRDLKRLTREVAFLRAIALFFVLFFFFWVAFGCFGWSKPTLEGFAVEGGIAMTPEFLALWVGLTLFTSASIAEIVRAGVLTVGRRQWMAGQALGLTDGQVLTNIILPQSLRLVIPPLASQFMNLTKNSSLAVIIGYPDIVNIGNTSIVIMGQALEAIVIIMCVYLLLNLVIAFVMGRINRRVNASWQKGFK
ncbi:MAG TPA: amino acid ABC transporter permease, partial [Sutterella sp.]|nr:amino acid ABC transporter permease [Sutterella sp.]